MGFDIETNPGKMNKNLLCICKETYFIQIENYSDNFRIIH